MKLHIASINVQSPPTFMLQASVPTSLFNLPLPSPRWGGQNRNLVNPVILRSKKFLQIQPCSKTSSHQGFGEEPTFENGNKKCCATSESENERKDSFLVSRFDSLEPRMLGIKPEPPNWPEREAILWASVEQKAKSFGLPLSLRMIKKKHQWEAGFRNLPESVTTSSCSVRKAFSSMVFIVVELQSHALHMREKLCHEDLEAIIMNVQREIYASFVWLFRQVFSRTPALMIYVMILLANFSMYSTSHNVAIAEPLLEMACDHETTSIGGGQIKYPRIDPEELSKFADEVLRSDKERELWESIEDEALNMRGFKDIGLDHEVMLRFVSPLSVEIETDNSVDYFKTDLLYQMALSNEPYNTLLLCNYAQFLQVIARDYNRAEECLKRAIQVEPPEAEVLNQYANFLWKVKKDLWAAEERYQQAAAAEPRNPYYASTYANFLWSTGGEETCFPPTSTSFNNKRSEEV